MRLPSNESIRLIFQYHIIDLSFSIEETIESGVSIQFTQIQ